MKLDDRMTRLIADIADPDKFVFVWIGTEEYCPDWLRYLITETKHKATQVSGFAPGMDTAHQTMCIAVFDLADIGALEIAAAIRRFKACGLMSIGKVIQYIQQSHASGYTPTSCHSVLDEFAAKEFKGFFSHIKREQRKADAYLLN